MWTSLWSWLLNNNTVNTLQGRIYCGVNGLRTPPPLIFPYVESLLKDLSSDFSFFSTPNIMKVRSIFAPNSTIFYRKFQNKFGVKPRPSIFWGKKEKSLLSNIKKFNSECRRMHHFAFRFSKISRGDTSDPPSAPKFIIQTWDPPFQMTLDLPLHRIL